MQKRLVKSKARVFTGVLGGVSEYFDWEPTLVRIIYTIATFLTGIVGGCVVYVIASMIMPAD